MTTFNKSESGKLQCSPVTRRLITFGGVQELQDKKNAVQWSCAALNFALKHNFILWMAPTIL